MTGTTGILDLGNTQLSVVSGGLSVTANAPTPISSSAVATMIADLATDKANGDKPRYSEGSTYQVITAGTSWGWTYEVLDGLFVRTGAGSPSYTAFSSPSHFDAFWAGAGTTNAPSVADYWQGALGVNNDGASTANVYHIVEVSGTLTWVNTGATVANFFGA